ncbi:hypothetical protein F5Y19DRAFT_469268 [Xylariaceae sp. FL1651]|nr:hypothetical protein F5Y19DRAFT_469268 [Xylariaceae sp. FL1651]
MANINCKAQRLGSDFARTQHRDAEIEKNERAFPRHGAPITAPPTQQLGILQHPALLTGMGMTLTVPPLAAAALVPPMQEVRAWPAAWATTTPRSFATDRRPPPLLRHRQPPAAAAASWTGCDTHGVLYVKWPATPGARLTARRETVVTRSRRRRRERPLRAHTTPYVAGLGGRTAKARSEDLLITGSIACTPEDKPTEEIMEQAEWRPMGAVAGLVSKPDQSAEEIVDQVVN